MRHVVVGLGDGGGTKGVGLDQVSPGGQIALVDVLNQVRAGERQQLVIAFDVFGEVFEALASVLRLTQLEALDHGAHGPVEDEDTAGQPLRQVLGVGVVNGFHGGAL